ncbi:MAG: tetratricopeptide repeat protein [Thermoguttaceae bacterium]|nr:tetratricopeptide repeat protein [Thermoguttaceae bacterium]MDW8039224.1 tetratricopeptide repeat protein [Thermoguttaceae bacterium]
MRRERARELFALKPAPLNGRHFLWIVWLLLGGVCGGGCRWLRPALPVEETLLASRQLSRQAMEALAQRRWEEALSLAQQAVQTCSADLDARQLYAEALWAKGLRAEAIRQMEELVGRVPEEARLHARMAQMQWALGRFGEARQYANQAIERNPQLPEAWLVRARVARELGDLRSALADYQRALAYAPNHREVLLEMAELYRALQQPDRALATLHQLADTYAPGEEPAQLLYLQGVVYSELGRYQEAAEQLRLAIQRERPCADWLYELARAQVAAGQWGLAQHSLRQALALEPGHRGSLELLQRLESVEAAQNTR